jgi:hypothetical protein
MKNENAKPARAGSLIILHFSFLIFHFSFSGDGTGGAARRLRRPRD